MSAFRLLVLAGCIALPLRAHGAGTASTAATPAIAEFIKHSSADTFSHDTLERRLLAWATAGATIAELEANTVRDYGVPPALAHELVALSLRHAAIDFDPAQARETRRIEQRRLALVDRYPGVWLAFEEAGRDAAAALDCDGARIDALMVKWPDPDAARRRLASVAWCPQLLSPLTGTAGANAEPFVTFARYGQFDGPLGLAAWRVASAKVDADPSVPLALRGEVHALRLRSELDEGRLSAAIAALPAEGSPLFAAVLAHLSGGERLDLAAAAAAIGRTAVARRWRELAAVPAPEGTVRFDDSDFAIGRAGDDSAATRASRAGELRRRGEEMAAQRLELLAWWLGERKGDPFALLIGPEQFGTSPFAGDAWRAIHAAVAVREAYPMLALPDRAPDVEYLARQRREAIAACHRCAAELLAAIEAAGKELETNDPALPVLADAASPDDRPADLLARIDRAIDGPPLPWVEQGLPPALRTQRKVAKDDEDCLRCLVGDVVDAAAPAWRTRVPRGELVRWGRDGDRIVAITASQTLDPVGELSSGGYWVSVSEDGGETFAPPLYTGLRVYSPYVVRPDSKIPLLDGDTLQLEVAVRELDAEKVMLPPVHLPLKRSADDLFLRIALADLRRDGDDDGLTDAIEGAMLLDPASADTDGDGIRDGADMLPNVPWRDGAGNERVAALAPVFEAIGAEFGAVITTHAHAPGADPAQAGSIGAGSAARNEFGVVFLQAPTDVLAAMSSRSPVIVLGADQVARLRKARGAFYPIAIGGFAINRAGDEGAVWWSAGWTGGSFRLHKRDGRWQAETQGAWITGAPARVGPTPGNTEAQSAYGTLGFRAPSPTDEARASSPRCRRAGTLQCSKRYSSSRVTSARNVPMLTTSVIVVRKMLEAVAGSAPMRLSRIGIAEPDTPATMHANAIDTMVMTPR
jgi:hypothetical protein